ncbi:MAG: response regulator transcription factor [Deltaproteobacteria bacterium]|nr:response regulator transcription factor [Deltaproteobacteria bacterium]
MADKILVVEDEADIRTLITYHLSQERFRVLEAENGEDALDLVQQEPPRLIVLDLMLPNLSGLDFCKIIRQNPETAQTPILMLTAKAGEADRVVGLELGADDYITKPFSPREMVARVKAVLRRTETQTSPDVSEIYEKGPLRVNFTTYEVHVAGRPVKLTLKGFEVLRFLIQNRNRVLSRDQILDGVWRSDVYVTPRTVDVHIRRIREALEHDDRNPEWIVTVRGVGYKLDERTLEN